MRGGETAHSSSGQLPSKRRSSHLSTLLLYTQNTQASLKRRDALIPKRHQVFSLDKTCRRIPTGNPLLCCHNPSTVREGISCRNSRPLGSITQLPGLMHFLAQHVQGHATIQCHLCQLPILQEEREKEILSPGPYNPMTCSASLHTWFSRESLEDTLSSSGQASPSLFHIGLFGQHHFHSSPRSRA